MGVERKHNNINNNNNNNNNIIISSTGKGVVEVGLGGNNGTASTPVSPTPSPSLSSPSSCGGDRRAQDDIISLPLAGEGGERGGGEGGGEDGEKGGEKCGRGAAEAIATAESGREKDREKGKKKIEGRGGSSVTSARKKKVGPITPSSATAPSRSLPPAGASARVPLGAPERTAAGSTRRNLPERDKKKSPQSSAPPPRPAPQVRARSSSANKTSVVPSPRRPSVTPAPKKTSAPPEGGVGERRRTTQSHRRNSSGPEESNSRGVAGRAWGAATSPKKPVVDTTKRRTSVGSGPGAVGATRGGTSGVARGKQARAPPSTTTSSSSTTAATHPSATAATPPSAATTKPPGAGVAKRRPRSIVASRTIAKSPSSVPPGERNDEVELTKRHHADNGGSLVKEARKSEHAKQKERRKSEGERPKEKERKRDGERAKGANEKLKEREKKDKKLEYERLRIGEREKRRSEREKEKRKSFERERKAPNEERRDRKKSGEERERKKSGEERERKKSGEERERKKSSEREKRRSEEREKRRSEERERRRSEERVKRKSPEKAKRESERRERSLDKEYARLSLSPEKRLSSSSGSGRMVQQSGTSGGGGSGSGAGSRGEQDDPERAELERRERIQRYKDERRKQIAARYGTAEWSSSEESGTGEESSYRAYRRRRRAGRDNNDSSTNDLSSQDAAKRPHENGSSLEGRGSGGGRRGVLGSSSEDVVAAAGSVRTTRASRLRQAALTSPNANNNNNNSNNNNNNSGNNNNSFNNNNNNNSANPVQELKDSEGVGERGRGEAPPDLPPPKRPPDQGDARAGVGVGGDSADSTLSGSDGRSGRARRAGGEERDKSHKRKSNLNRSTTEEATADPFPLTHPSDSNEDTPRRRRRRTPLSPVGGGLPSVAAAEPLKTPEVVRHVVSRLTPPPSPPASSQPLSSPSSQPSPPAARRHPSPQPPPAPPPNTFQPIQPAQPALGSPQGTQSAPSTLDSRHSRHTHQQGLFGASVTSEVSSARRVSASSENEEALSTRKVPPKLAPLRKPEIPDVLRPKDNTSLASPGVVSTPPTSRPSSVVLDKPPLAPEGLRPAALRSSLRKPSDTGTCFLAARREKRDESTNGTATGAKNDLFREQQKPKKGDRLSRSDMNLKIESNSGGRSGDISTPTNTSDAEGGEASSPPLASPSLPNAEVMSSRLEALTARARDAMDRADRLTEDATITPESADTMVHECEQYLTTVTASGRRESPGTPRRRDVGATGMEAASERPQPSPASVTGVLSDTGQKNWVGGSEGRGKESKRMANEKEVKKETKRESQVASGGERIPDASAGPSGPPDYVAFMDENVSPPPEEVVLGLQHRHLEDEEDEGSDTSPLRSPEHRGSGRCRPRRCSLDGDSPRTNSPDPQSILKRRSSREDVMPERPTTPEPHSILKRKTSSRTSSLDAQEGEPRPILKKKSSAEELEHFEPRPILKKKSSTDDELDDRPRSILKGGRSREDLDRSEGVISPNPILKRSPRYDSEGEGELRPILKRRDTTDGVRLRLHVSDGEDVDDDLPSHRLRSDSAPESAIRMRGRSPPAASATPAHGILKKRGAHSPARFDQMDNELGAILRSRRSLGPGDAEAESPSSSTPMRPVSPSLVALTKREENSPARTGERPLSVAERVAGMEAARQEPSRPPAPRSPTPTRSPGARPKVTSAFLNNIRTPEAERESRRNGAYSLVAEPAVRGESAEAINEAFLDRPVVEAFNSAMTSSLDSTPDTPSSVSQRAAFFAQLEREQKKPADANSGSRPTRFGSRRERGTRHATQPVTEDEVSQAARMADASDSASASHDSDCTPARRESPSGFRAAREAVLRNAGEVLQGLTPGSSPRRRAGSRKTSFNEPEEDNSSDGVRGILKRESSGGSRDGQRDSPRSILKHHHSSSSADSRRASFSESEGHPRGILKAESPLPPPVGSPDHEAKLLRGVLKKDSSLEDSKEIKSILKPESESLDPDHSSDSSSDDVTLTTANTPQGQECDLAEAIRDIDPVRHKEEQHKSDSFKSEHHRVDLAEALRQVEPIKAKDDLAEALRQIEPIRAKDRSREREDRVKDDAQTAVTKEINSSKKTSSMMSTTMVATSSVGSPSSSSSSSNSENELKVIKNEAVMRRRTAHSRRYDERRSMVELRSLEKDKLSPEDSSSAAAPSAVSPSNRYQQPTPQDGGGSDSSTSSSSSSDSCDGVLKTKAKVTMDASQILSQSPIFRNKTSLTSSSSTSSSSSSPSPSDGAAKAPPGAATSPGSSINDRLAALQRNGEEGWKSRLKNDGKDVNSNVTLRPKPAGGLRERPVSLMERMSALENSSQQWRGRVSQSDATKFTVAHKMASASTSCVPSIVSGVTPVLTVTPDQPTTPIGSPTVERKKRSPSQKVFKSKTGGNIPSLLGKSSPLSAKKDFRRSISTPNDRDKKAEAVEGPSVAVPRADDEDFMAFFSKSSATETVQSPEDGLPSLGEADFDLISETASQLVVKRRSVRVTRRQATSRNPLKALAAREDIKSEYTEVKLGIGEKELKRMKVEELSKGSPLAVEALAGLASKENFSAVALKKVENTPVVREMAPYTSLMLLQVKGRRHAQTRLVKPAVSSVNQGDDFLLITPTEVFHYKGEFANVIERAKASEIAQYVVQKKDMGVASAVRNVIELDENSPSGRKAKFWRLIGGDDSSVGQVCGMPDEDEFVEASLVAANKVYEVQEDSLVPVPDSWGQMPKIEILQSDKVLVFDFGPELYIWAGKRACGDERKVGLALGRELWEEEYDYSECDINPITPMVPLSQASLKGTRPEWGLCAKLTENVETIVFKEKFIDWPDLAQQSRIKEVKKDMDRHVAPVCELQPCDARVMLEELPPEPDLVLEMSHLGRGVEYYDEEERRLLNISTNDFKVWHVSEYGKVLMDEKARNHLHEGDTYVVRWYYLITATGRTLKGEPSKHNVTGRSRVAYFFWQGKDSSVSDKGVSALMTVELDEERGPHVRVSMNSEPPAFLNLFQGGLIVHKGRRDEEKNSQGWKLFVVRGELENEGHLVEVEVNSSFLRSRGCLVLVNTKTGIIHLWHGAKALRHTRKVGSITAQKLTETSDSEVGWTPGTTKKLKEQFEGAESRDFWEGFGGSSAKNKHFSLLEDEHSYDWTPRVWHMVATHDSFQANEVICSYRATSVPNPLPVLQSDLYTVAQPALFVVDGGHRVWVWQGWWPDESVEGQDSNTTGSAVLRFNFARRAALETTLNYCKLKAKAQAKALAAKSYKKIEVEVDVVEPQLVVAGMEPLEFTSIFPTWTPRPDVTAIQEKEGRWNHGGQYSVSEILAQLSRTNYSLAELTTKPLPDGADPLHLEVYLSNEEFAEALGMSRDEFYSLQSWKQTELKKKANLF
ncbi:serine/arginine repetitive matrix protein 2-like isoform X2 [Penaeus japonicus]|uniref:serine/arginine repetitive matrix protein 2-like isoform X2 n=1 Tax=Penaeus japonicus TaxID=27405 RepID=UPI001C70E422|nr:serine/arginine repetitive matrix protein 2-like isoform X2 [Penaeus japonicus]